eukprot:symbB.v1.2.021721.t1/scaffold1893.1/size96936/6
MAITKRMKLVTDFNRPENEQAFAFLLSSRSQSSQHSMASGFEAVDPVESERGEIQIQEFIPQIAKKIAEMDVTNPEILRVTRAFSAFQNVAKALRVGCDGDFYHKSFKSHKISTFWSHSWHGGYWKKIITLLTLYNGPAALFCGFLTATLMAILFCFGILPGIDRGWGPWVPFSPWCLPSGFVVTIVVMISWRSPTKVFLDRLCISQKDDRLKAQAIFSLAGFLKKSDEMLILWDPTWTERLWCLFELAAFLKSKKMTSGKQVLIVRPLFWGPISIAVFTVSFVVGLPFTTVSLHHSTIGIVLVMAPGLLSGLVVAYPTVLTLRSYFRELDIMKEQLLTISFDATRSACCDQNHLDAATGAPLLCDRRVVKECVKIWFGSQEAFEDAVRSEVLDMLMVVLNEKVFTYTWTLSVTMPFFWTFLDLSVTFTPFSSPTFWEHASVKLLIEGLVLWLLAFPSVKDLLIMFCRLTRAKGRTLCIEIFKNLMVALSCGFFMSSLLVLYLVAQYADGYLSQTLAWSGAVVLFSIVSRLGSVGVKVILKHCGSGMKAGGCGLNLIGANRLVMFDPDWNPANDRQAMARVWRDGQKKPCYIYRLFTTGTIDEKVYQRQICKDGLSTMMVTETGEDEAQMTESLASDLVKDLFTFSEKTACATHDMLNCQRCTNSTVPQEDDVLEDDLSTWSHHPGTEGVKDEILLMASKELLKLPTWTRGGSTNLPLGGVSFTMGCHIEYTKEQIAKLEAEERAEQERRKAKVTEETTDRKAAVQAAPTPARAPRASEILAGSAEASRSKPANEAANVSRAREATPTSARAQVSSSKPASEAARVSRAPEAAATGAVAPAGAVLIQGKSAPKENQAAVAAAGPVASALAVAKAARLELREVQAKASTAKPSKSAVIQVGDPEDRPLKRLRVAVSSGGQEGSKILPGQPRRSERLASR